MSSILFGLMYVLGAYSHYQTLKAYELVVSMHKGTRTEIIGWEKSLLSCLWFLSIFRTAYLSRH